MNKCKCLITIYFLSVICWINAQPTITLQQNSLAAGDDLVVHFADGPGNSSDWIGVYPEGITPDGNPAATLWKYTNGTQNTGGNATSGTVTFANIQLSVGTYSVWFLKNNGYTALAGPITFSVIETPQWVTPLFRRRHAVTGKNYTGKISAYATGSAISFSKLSGPSWLHIDTEGNLTGSPTSTDIGKNTFTIRASNTLGNADATMTIQVFAPGTETVTELKIMSFNLWHGFGKINNGYRKGLSAIILADADIVGTQETVANTTTGNYQVKELAEDLGWYWSPTASGDSGILSRYPITEKSTLGEARRIKVTITDSPRREIIHYNCHIDYLHYGPYEAQKNGATAQSVLEEELKSQRDEQIAVIMNGMNTDLNQADTTPVFLTGDFNSPSHLDWTPEMASHHGGISGVAWPATTAVEQAGMLDSFRTVHPNPVTHPGFTWSPLQLGDPQDRIDFIFYKGSACQPIHSEHFHTEIETTLGAWGSDITPAQNNTWPSDHGAMLTIFKLSAVDTDSDGLSDAFEIQYFGDLTSQSGQDDADADGKNNLLEQLLGTSPTQANDAPPLKVITHVSANDPVQIQFQMSPLAYDTGLILEKSNDLQNWTSIWSYHEDPEFQSSNIQKTESPNGNWMIQINDSSSGNNQTKIFYRLKSGE